MIIVALVTQLPVAATGAHCLHFIIITACDCLASSLPVMTFGLIPVALKRSLNVNVTYMRPDCILVALMNSVPVIIKL